VSSGQLKLLVALALAWVLARFFLVATAISLRTGQGARAEWVRRLEARGYFNTSFTSGEMFAMSMHKCAAALARLKGAGATGSLIFALASGIILFLWSLPLNELYQARASYDQARREIASAQMARTAPLNACAVEHALREIERQTGSPILRVPDGLRVYPFDEASRQRLEAVYPRYSVELYLREFLQGNKLTENPRDLIHGIRAVPGYAEAIDRLTSDGRLVPALADYVIRSPENEALMNDIRAFCRGEPSPPNRTFVPIRPRAEYQQATDRLRFSIIAMMDDPLIRDSYNLYHERSAQMQLLLSLLYSLGAGLLVLLSLKIAIGLCRWTRTRAGVVSNVLRVAFAVPAIIAATLIFIAFNGAFTTAAPIAVSFFATRAPAASIEQDYRRRMNHYADSVGRITLQTCADIGPNSPLSPGCRLVDAFLEPWDPERGTFDFQAAIPRQSSGGEPLPDTVMTMLQGGLLTMLVAVGTLQQEPGVSGGHAFWGGLHSSPAFLFLLMPLLFVLASGVACLLLTDARRMLANRLAKGGL
jgi:hypothetical protein